VIFIQPVNHFRRVGLQIDCYLMLDCQVEQDLRANIGRALADEGLDAGLNFYRIDEQQACELGLHEPVTIFVNGDELLAGYFAGFS
jgi:hypothetical protein